MPARLCPCCRLQLDSWSTYPPAGYLPVLQGLAEPQPPLALFLWAKANFSPSSPSFLHVQLCFTLLLMLSPSETGNPLRANPGAGPSRASRAARTLSRLIKRSGKLICVSCPLQFDLQQAHIYCDPELVLEEGCCEILPGGVSGPALAQLGRSGLQWAGEGDRDGDALRV